MPYGANAARLDAHGATLDSGRGELVPATGWTDSARLKAYVPALLFCVCLSAQLYLVFFKSFNWDEFLHFGQIYQIRAGTFSQPLQVLHARILWWAPEVADNLVNQMLAARMFMWGMNLVTLAMIFGIARQFTSARNAFFAAFAYLTAGYVFTQAFSIRADPLVTATLMGALFLLARGPLSVLKAVAVGALIGLAGMMTVKAIFYAPCFAGLAWLKSREAPGKVQFLGKLIILAVAALVSFTAIYLYHTADLAEAATPVHDSSRVSGFLRWVSGGMPFAGYSAKEIMLAPVFFIGLAIAPLGWSKAGLKSDEKVALTGFIAPLVVLFFYRNTFPYFFVFILAPVAVAIAPAFGFVRGRTGTMLLSLVLSIAPLTMAVLEPREVIARQRALIDYVHREFPKKTGYLDYSGMIADYPRILKYLTSGNGIRHYHEQGNSIVAREIDRGNVPFIIANQAVIAAALEGHPIPRTFLSADLAAMTGNYVQQWGVLWREGKQIPAGTRAFQLQLRRGGRFVLDGSSLTIDHTTVAHGATIRLSEGPHVVGGRREGSSTLWRGSKLPTPPPNLTLDSVFTNF